ERVARDDPRPCAETFFHPFAERGRAHGPEIPAWSGRPHAPATTANARSNGGWTLFVKLLSVLGQVVVVELRLFADALVHLVDPLVLRVVDEPATVDLLVAVPVDRRPGREVLLVHDPHVVGEVPDARRLVR